MIELLTAMAILSVVLLFVFQTFMYQHATYQVTDQVSEAHQTVQGAARLIERDLRNAGYMVPHAAASCGVDVDNGPDTLYVSDTDAIRPADQLPVEIAKEELGAPALESDKPTSATTAWIGVDDVVVDAQASYDTDGNGTNDSDFRVGGGAILIDRGNPNYGVACGIVAGLDLTPPYQVQVTWQSLLATGAASDLVLVPAHVYRITGTAPPQLQRDGSLLAKDVEDLQVAWYYDDNTNRVVDANEIKGVTGNNYVTSGVDGDELREVRINLITRTRGNDPRNPDDAGVGQTLENRTTASAPGDDGRHRRVHTATVFLRNLSL